MSTTRQISMSAAIREALTKLLRDHEEVFLIGEDIGVYGGAFKITRGIVDEFGPERIIVSPGPCTPTDAGLSKNVVARFGSQLPLLGVCLGHQCISEVYGGEVVRADRLMHGKTSQIHHDGKGVFVGLPNPFVATRYHSLVVPSESLPDELELAAWTDDADHPREVMGFRHREYPVHGVQFHPESFLTEVGSELLKNFLALPVD